MDETFFDTHGNKIKTVRVTAAKTISSPKATRYLINNKPVWIPESQILWEEGDEIVIPEWLAIEKEIV